MCLPDDDNDLLLYGLHRPTCRKDDNMKEYGNLP